MWMIKMEYFVQKRKLIILIKESLASKFNDLDQQVIDL